MQSVLIKRNHPVQFSLQFGWFGSSDRFDPLQHSGRIEFREFLYEPFRFRKYPRADLQLSRPDYQRHPALHQSVLRRQSCKNFRHDWSSFDSWGSLWIFWTESRCFEIPVFSILFTLAKQKVDSSNGTSEGLTTTQCQRWSGFSEWTLSCLVIPVQ